MPAQPPPIPSTPDRPEPAEDVQDLRQLFDELVDRHLDGYAGHPPTWIRRLDEQIGRMAVDDVLTASFELAVADAARLMMRTSLSLRLALADFDARREPTAAGWAQDWPPHVRALADRLDRQQRRLEELQTLALRQRKVEAKHGPARCPTAERVDVGAERSASAAAGSARLSPALREKMEQDIARSRAHAGTTAPTEQADGRSGMQVDLHEQTNVLGDEVGDPTGQPDGPSAPAATTASATGASGDAPEPIPDIPDHAAAATAPEGRQARAGRGQDSQTKQAASRPGRPDHQTTVRAVRAPAPDKQADRPSGRQHVPALAEVA